MNEGFPVRLAVNEVVELFVIGLEQIAVGRHGYEQAVLGAEVGAGGHHRLDAIAEHVDERFQIFQGILTLFLEDGMDIVRAGGGGHVPFADVADALRMGEERGWHQRNVAEGRAGC